MKRAFVLFAVMLVAFTKLQAQDVYTDHTCVDLGLSVKWASYNLGATAPEQMGYSFAWGETKPKSTFTESNYRFFVTEKYEGYLSTYDRWVAVKYCVEKDRAYKGFVDNRRFLEPVDDAATVQWGENWRMPTTAEWKELQDFCSWFWTTSNGQTGYLVTSLVNGNSIFLPSSGKTGDDVTAYWTCCLNTNTSAEAAVLAPDKAAFYPGNRMRGFFVRAVMDGERHEIVLPPGFVNYRDYAHAKGDRFSTKPQNLIERKVPEKKPALRLETAIDGTIGSHGYVDLGLSVKWATTNLGADKAVDAGNCFAWGETVPKDNSKVENYKLATKVTVKEVSRETGKEHTWTKYVVNKYNDDSIREKANDYWERTESPHVPIKVGSRLEAVDDAATAQWGKDWRMPSTEEFVELAEKCMWIPVQREGMSGYLVQSKVNGNSIFLPFSGSEEVFTLPSPSIVRNRRVGRYWSRTRARDINMAKALYMTPEAIKCKGDTEDTDSYYRWSLLNVRPVTSVAVKSTRKQTKTTSIPVHSKVSPVLKGELKAAPVAVDLGLSVKWASFNVGATVPEEPGSFFAWGETFPKTEFEWKNYAFVPADNPVNRYTRGPENLLKYNGPKSSLKLSGTNRYDLLQTLEAEDDAATANWGGGWRTPTVDEFRELMEKCDWSVSSRNGVKGWDVKSRVNGNSIFLPSVKIESVVSAHRRDGAYMTSSLSEEDVIMAYRVEWLSPSREGDKWMKTYERFRQSSLRPVQGAPVLGKKVDAPEPQPTATAPGDLAGHGYVDMGVSVLWATCNIGADNPYDYGDIFAWGETEQKVDKASSDRSKKYSRYALKTTKYFKSSAYTKYVHKSAKARHYDEIEVLEPIDDAAVQNWGNGWRMPTWQEARELFNNCTGELLDKDGTYYVKLTSRINGNELIFPFWNFRWIFEEEGKVEKGVTESYWTSSLNDEKSAYGTRMYFSNKLGDRDETTKRWTRIYQDPYLTFEKRFRGLAIRPVAPKKD